MHYILIAISNIDSLLMNWLQEYFKRRIIVGVL